jgi:hypothetical protein
MRKYLSAALLLAAAFLFQVPDSVAQSSVVDVPRGSQHAVVMQRIGITNITINYHRPLVNKRKVWGGLVPFGQVWRAGANENTTIEFTDAVTVEGQPLAKGLYGLHMLPGENEWTVIFSRMNAAWGSFSYDQKEDALRVTVKPQPSEMHEAVTYDFDDPKSDAVTVTLRWEKLAAPFKIGVNTHEIVTESLHHQLRGLAQYTFEGWDDSANYFLAEKYNLEEALKYSDRSIGVEERFDNLMTKASILDTLDRKTDAEAARKRALPLASAQQLHNYGRQLQIQGKQEEAFGVFRENMKKNPNHWTAHNEASRIAVAKGDFDGAVREMKLAKDAAPEQIKAPLDGIVKRLEKKEDINK